MQLSQQMSLRGLNISLAYKGVRSLGQYQHILTSTGDFRGTVFYESPDKHYQLKAHLVKSRIAQLKKMAG